jgi:hypothetical protein
MAFLFPVSILQASRVVGELSPDVSIYEEVEWSPDFPSLFCANVRIDLGGSGALATDGHATL